MLTAYTPARGRRKPLTVVIDGDKLSDALREGRGVCDGWALYVLPGWLWASKQAQATPTAPPRMPQVPPHHAPHDVIHGAVYGADEWLVGRRSARC